MAKQIQGDYFFSNSELSCHDARILYTNKQLLQEKKELQEQVGLLQTLLRQDAQELHREKCEMREALFQSCVREQTERGRLKEEETENDCLLDAIADLKYIQTCSRSRRLSLKGLKQEVIRANCANEEIQHALAQKDEIIRRKDLTIKELQVSCESCSEHVARNAARLKEAERAVRQRKLVRVRQKACKVNRSTQVTIPPVPVKPVHRKVTQSRGNGMLVTVCCFALALLFLLFFFISIVNREVTLSTETMYTESCTELFKDKINEFL